MSVKEYIKPHFNIDMITITKKDLMDIKDYYIPYRILYLLQDIHKNNMLMRRRDCSYRVCMNKRKMNHTTDSVGNRIKTNHIDILRSIERIINEFRVKNITMRPSSEVTVVGTDSIYVMAKPILCLNLMEYSVLYSLYVHWENKKKFKTSNK